MISYAKIKSTLIEKSRRILKVVEFGPKTAIEVAPFGEDGNPLKDMVAIYSKTTEAGERVILGYINKNQISQPGEKRIYSLTPEGAVSFSIHLKGDGTCEIGGDVDNMVRFQALDTALKAQDNLINAELAKIAIAIGSLGGSYVVAPVSTDISASKIEEVKSS